MIFKKVIFFLLISQIAIAQQSMFNAGNKSIKNTSAVASVVGPIISGGLVLNLDPSNTTSYSGTGGTWSDLSGASNHAILTNNPVFTATAPGYFTFSGNNNAHLNFAWPTDFTCSFWIYPLSAPGGGYSRIISTGPGDNLEIASNSNNQISYYTPSVNWQSYKATILGNTWNQVVFVKSASTLNIYVNGSLAYTSIITTTPGSSLYLGQRYNSGEGVNMRLGGVLIYSRAISGSEITSNWTNQKARFGL
jgi:hypothetical protein